LKNGVETTIINVGLTDHKGDIARIDKIRIMKLKDLKELLNKQSDEQLEKDIIVWGEERGSKIINAMNLEEDYTNLSGDGCEPLSSYKDEEDYEEAKENVVYEKGRIILTEEF